jgi:23S rRNA A1618 N6-methylase RlmF
LDGRARVDFYPVKNQRIVTQVLLKEYFDLNVELPENYLCPPVPQRLNYLLWVQELLILSGDLIDKEHRESLLGFDM